MIIFILFTVDLYDRSKSHFVLKSLTEKFHNVGSAAVQRGAKTKGGRAAAAASNATSCPDQAPHGAGQGRRGDVAQEAPKEEREQQQQRRRGRADHFLQYPDVAATVVTDPAAGFHHHNTSKITSFSQLCTHPFLSYE